MTLSLGPAAARDSGRNSGEACYFDSLAARFLRSSFFAFLRCFAQATLLRLFNPYSLDV